ncbi:Alcohol dehydrogenase-like 3 [Acorus calamus]|uniref:Alcohol dehydrogenase-like 3 n=1 Tax=Acorus calamus TaxID=4465 RepID=A0AAV9FIK7_ACOCL|nr:Alcohol dehydrogenase-like 3 [Acorus calamus]
MREGFRGGVFGGIDGWRRVVGEAKDDGWGLTVVLGIHTTPTTQPIHPMELLEGRRIVGSVFGDFKGKSQLLSLADRCMDGEINLEGFITHQFPFVEINGAFKLLVEGKCLRCLLVL